MRPFGRWLGRILLALILAAVVVGLWKREEITRILAVNSLVSEEKIVQNFSHMNDLFLSTLVPRGSGPVSDLPKSAPMTLPTGAEDWIRARYVTSLPVLKDGAIRHESHHLGTGTAFMLGGLNFITRDHARFALMIAQNGRYDGKQIVQAGWIAESTRPSSPTAPGEFRYGYQWWMPPDGREGEFLARGVYGQYLYFDRPRGVAIVATAADRDFLDEGVDVANIAMFRAIAEAL